MKWPIFCHYNGDEVKWFRVFGWGLCFKKDRLSFSERNGYEKVTKLWGNWRVKGLKR